MSYFLKNNSLLFICNSQITLYTFYYIVDAPDVDVVSRVNSIDCFANGYPKTYTFYEWEHQSEQGKHIRFLDGLQNGTLNLQTLPQQYQIGGKYICSVTNGISDLNGSMIQKGFGSFSYIGTTYLMIIALTMTQALTKNKS